MLDASITLSWCFADEQTPETGELLAYMRASYCFVPHLWTYEVANILTVAERKGRIDAQLRSSFLSELQRLDVRAAGLEMHSLMQLARDTQLTVYDASYLLMARNKGLPLATLDRHLRNAARSRDVAVLPA